MAFAERELRFTFSGEKTGTLSVAGLRAFASIQVYQGRLGVSAQVRIWGLTMAQMNAYSSRISSSVGVYDFSLTIEAGDVGGTLRKIVDGSIMRSYVDLSGSPESAFNVSVVGIYDAAKAVAPTSQPGAQNAEDLIAAICAGSGLKFQNNGAHAVLRNHSTYGSTVDQMVDIARAAKFEILIEGKNVSVYPANGTVDGVIVEVGPDDGMVGYPVFWEAGIIVTTLFDPQIRVGRQMSVTSSIPNANGLWTIVRANHDLATMLREGPWFTTAFLAAPGGA